MNPNTPLITQNWHSYWTCWFLHQFPSLSLNWHIGNNILLTETNFQFKCSIKNSFDQNYKINDWHILENTNLVPLLCLQCSSTRLFKFTTTFVIYCLFVITDLHTHYIDQNFFQYNNECYRIPHLLWKKFPCLNFNKKSHYLPFLIK